MSGESFTTIVIEACTLPEETQLKGSFAAETSFAPQRKRPLKFSEPLTKSVNEKLSKEKAAELNLTYGSATAYITGELSAELSGEKHAGAEWQRALRTKACEELPAANTTVCPAGQHWPSETLISSEKTAASEMMFKISVTTTTCTGSQLEGKTTADEGAPLTGNLIVVKFTPCNNGCTVNKMGSPVYTLTTDGTRNGGGSYQIPRLELEFVCGATTCKYTTSPAYFIFAGGKSPLLSGGPMNMARQAGVPPACANPGRWEGAHTLILEGLEYGITFPTPLFLTG